MTEQRHGITTKDSRQTECTYLTLGDGDFTFSYDLCRFLQAEQSLALSAEDFPQRLRIVCSGIDSLCELKAKYKDSVFVLKQIEALNVSCPLHGNQHKDTKEKSPKKLKINGTETLDANNAQHLTVSIHHAVNAIVPWSDDRTMDQSTVSPSPSLPPCNYKYVIFNHPHIGREDAQLHSRFLSHFFYSVKTHWLARHGVVHLALVKGQCERWKCIEAAERQGLVLLHRDTFKPPPSPGHYLQACVKEMKLLEIPSHYQSQKAFQCQFQQRRHQSGRSFASRAKDGSETLSFGRKDDLGEIAEMDRHLPWQNLILPEGNSKDTSSLPCPRCGKCFADERARKNHMKCVHAVTNEGEVGSNMVPIVCKLCQDDRVFSSEEALASHTRAKHTGQFTNIKPDWAAKHDLSSSTKTQNEFKLKNLVGSCHICGLEYESHAMKEHHYNEFVPDFVTDKTSEQLKDGVSIPFSCQHCKKVFRDERAWKQHENFCFQK